MTLTLVTSDLHVTSGRDPDTGKWSPLEEFFADHVFAQWLSHYHDAGPDAHLVLNGDTFDVEQVVELPPDEDLPAILGVSHLDRDRLRYGLGHSPPEVCWKLAHTAAGHPVFFRALADWVGRGHQLHFVVGNHDFELRYAQARERLVQLVAGARPDLAEEDVRSRIHFHDWYLYQPGQRLYVEHGGQYDPICHMDGKRVPAAYFNGRYMFNLLETRSPEADNIIPFSRYISWLLSTDTIPTLALILRQLPDLWRARRHAGDDLLPDPAPPDPRLPEPVEEAIRQAVVHQHRRVRATSRRTSLFTGAAMLLNLAARLAPLAAVALVVSGHPLLAILALAAWPLCQAGGSSIVSTYLHRSIILELDFVKGAAGEIAPHVADRVDTVVFGHTHQPDLARMAGGVRYYNTGTWIPLFCEDTRLERRDQARIYLEVRDGQARFLHWNDVLERPEPPVVIDRRAAPRYAARRVGS